MAEPHFVVTGFSRFPGVDYNPTEELVNRLLEDLETNATIGKVHHARKDLK